MESYLTNALIAFIALNAIDIFFYRSFQRINSEKKGVIKILNNFIKNFVVSLIPIFRWVWALFITIVYIAISVLSDEYIEEINKKLKKKD